jgi:hypothetical protein
MVLTAHPESTPTGAPDACPLHQATPGERDPRAFTPDESRRARAADTPRFESLAGKVSAKSLTGAARWQGGWRDASPGMNAFES